MVKYLKGVLKNSLILEENTIEILEENTVLPHHLSSLIIRSEGNFKGKGYYLGRDYDWQVIEDDMGELVLLKLRK